MPTDAEMVEGGGQPSHRSTRCFPAPIASTISGGAFFVGVTFMRKCEGTCKSMLYFLRKKTNDTLLRDFLEDNPSAFTFADLPLDVH
jgi:hypothetical protein